MNTKSNSILLAEADGIRYEDAPKTRRQCFGTIFYVPCVKCGKEIQTKIYKRDKVYQCEYCKRDLGKKKKDAYYEELENTASKKQIQFDKACERMKKHVKGFDDEYKSAIETASSRKELYGSIPEVIVAIELIHIGFSIIPQQKIGNFTVDFALPKHKLIIEVDGKIYHALKDDEARDYALRSMVGYDWKILHIPADMMYSNFKHLNKVMAKALK